MAVAFSGLNTTHVPSVATGARGETYWANGRDTPRVVSLRTGGTHRVLGVPANSTAPTFTDLGGSAASRNWRYRISWRNSTELLHGTPCAATLPSFAVKTSGVKVTFTPGASAPGGEAAIDKWVVWRTTDGQAATYYKVAEVAVGTTFYDDNNSDDTISVNETLDAGLDYGRPDTKYPYIAAHRGRLFLFGSNTVSGETPATRPSDFAWSLSVDQKEAFPALNAAGVFPEIGGQPTGLHVIGDTLHAFKDTAIFQLAYVLDPDPANGDGQVRILHQQRGLVNHRCCVPVGEAAYCLDRQGVYLLEGGSATPVDQGVRRLLLPSAEPASDRVNWSQWRKFHGVYDPARSRVVFFVCTGSDTEPRTAFCWSLERQHWTTESYVQGITASCTAPDGSGKARAWVADANGVVWAYGVRSAVDGASAASYLAGTLTGVAGAVLTDSGRSWTSNEFAGVPVLLGSGGTTEWGVVQSNTSTALTLAATPSGAVTTGTAYRLGAIQGTLKTQALSATDDPRAPHVVGDVTLRFDPAFSAGRGHRMRLVGSRVGVDTDYFGGGEHVAAPAADGWLETNPARTDGVLIAQNSKGEQDIQLELQMTTEYLAGVPRGPCLSLVKFGQGKNRRD